MARSQKLKIRAETKQFITNISWRESGVNTGRGASLLLVFAIREEGKAPRAKSNTINGFFPATRLDKGAL
jgi:hypothetical protein